jgi:hypothetical protein
MSDGSLAKTRTVTSKNGGTITAKNSFKDAGSLAGKMRAKKSENINKRQTKAVMKKLAKNVAPVLRKAIKEGSQEAGQQAAAKDPNVSTTSTTKNRRNLFGQNVKVTKTNTRTDYGNKVVDKKTKNKEVSLSPKRTVTKENTKDAVVWDMVRNKVAKKQMAANPKLQEGKGKDRVIKTSGREKTTTYGGNKKNIFGKEKAGTTVKRTKSGGLGQIGKFRDEKAATAFGGLAGLVGAGMLMGNKKP